MLRAILVLHRYVGVVIGIVMSVWCMSGFVMMYQSMPELSQVERLRGLEPLSLAGCCDLARLPVADAHRVSGLRIEMAAGRPRLRLSVEGEPAALFDLASGQPKTAFTDAEVLAVATAYGHGAGLAGAPRDLGVIVQDQWSVQFAKRSKPVHHLVFGDPAHTEIYVSGANGEVFLDTNRRERGLSWIGAVPHWLYPTILRQNGALWGQVVIWASTAGVFLTVTGLYIGLMKVGRGRDGALSPYKGVWWWHHVTGLVFGILTLTWVFSGLLTMNPWGLLESEAGAVRGPLAGTLSWGEVKAALTTPPATPGAVQLMLSPFGGQARLLATDAKDKTARLDAAGALAPVTRAEIEAALAKAKLKTASLTELNQEDSYYYAHHNEAPLPVWRAILADPQATRIYIDAATGRVVRTIDNNGRGTRWLSNAFHDFDWPVIRSRPVWDLVVIPLLLGVTVACLFGTWLGFLRIGRDFGAVKIMLRRRRRAGALAR